MTFAEAKDKVRKFANGKYFSVAYDYSEHSTGSVEVTCTVYVSDFGHHEAGTWEDAIDSLQGINIKPSPFNPEQEPQ